MKNFQKDQLIFTDYLRRMGQDATESEPIPRQQKIYQDLVYKNINQCIADVFPITKNIISNSDWRIMIQEFINSYRFQTPYFLEICQEFLAYLMHTRKPLPVDYPFMLELAHFEWIQLAMDIADIELPDYQHNSEPTESSFWRVSPLVVGLTYTYPVHIIDECYLPKESGSHPTYLLAYRNRMDAVNILTTDNLSLRIIQLLQTHEKITCLQIFQLLSTEIDNNLKEIMLPKIQLTLCALAEHEVVFCDPLH